MTDPVGVSYFYFHLWETPHKALNPNNTDHYMTKAKVKKKARVAMDRHHVTAPSTWPEVPTEVTWLIFWEKGRKILDNDNMLASMKAYQDGLADALGINDKLIVSTVHQMRATGDEHILALVRTK